MVTFGSSFNVCDLPQALAEPARILKPCGWFACMWNHRQLEHPIQAQIEAIMKEGVSEHGYDASRGDQTAVLDASGLFGPVVHLDSRLMHEQIIGECAEAWRSHADRLEPLFTLSSLPLKTIFDVLILQTPRLPIRPTSGSRNCGNRR
jgi:hypothetical protein